MRKKNRKRIKVEEKRKKWKRLYKKKRIQRKSRKN